VIQSGFVRRLAVSSDFHLILSACSIRSRIANDSIVGALSVLAIPPPAGGVNVPTFHAAEITEIYRVFLFALFAEYHLVTGDIGKHALDEIAAVGAVDIPKRQCRRFLLGVGQLPACLV
jgi:hypothetical protein